MTSTSKYFAVVAVCVGFVVDFLSVRSNIGDSFPPISAFLPFVGLVVASFSGVWIMKTAWLYYLTNRPASRFRRLGNKVFQW